MFRQIIHFLSETPESIETKKKANQLLQQAKQESDQDAINTIDLYAQAAKLGNTEALQILESAASNGNMCALHHLGNMYINGYGVEINRNKGDEFILKLPESEALHAKAIAYTNAVSRLRNMKDNLELDRVRLSGYDYQTYKANILNKSKEYFEQAIEALNKLNKLPESSTNNHANNLCLLGNIYVDFFEINQESVGDQTIELLKQAKDYFEQATKQGNAEASFHIGIIYEKGQKFAKAAEAYLEAHRMGHKDALNALERISVNLSGFGYREEVKYSLGIAKGNKKIWLSGLLNAAALPEIALQRIEGHYLREEISYQEACQLLQDLHEKHKPKPPSNRWIRSKRGMEIDKYNEEVQNDCYLLLAKIHLDQENIEAAEQCIHLLQYPKSEENQWNFKLAEMYLAKQYKEKAKQYLDKIASNLNEELSKSTELTTSVEDVGEKDIAIPSEASVLQEIVSSAETLDKIKYFAGLSEDQLLQLGRWYVSLCGDFPEMGDQAIKAFHAVLKINPKCEEAIIKLEFLESSDNFIESPSQKISNLLTKLWKLLPQLKLQPEVKEKLNESFSNLQYYFKMEQKKDVKKAYKQLLTDISQSGSDEKIRVPIINILNSLCKIIKALSIETAKEPSSSFEKKEVTSHEKEKEKEKEPNEITPPASFDFDIAIVAINHQIEELTNLAAGVAEELPNLTDLDTSECDREKDIAVPAQTSAPQMIVSSVKIDGNLVAKPQTDKKSGFLGMTTNFFQSLSTKPSDGEPKQIDTHTTAKEKIADDNHVKTAGEKQLQL